MSQVNNVAAVAIKVVSDKIYLASFITSDRICRDDVFTTLVVGPAKACTTPTCLVIFPGCYLFGM